MASNERGSRRKVLIVGTFDVSNYGDLLFPLIAAHRLGAAGIDVGAVSPTDALVPLGDVMRTAAIDDLVGLAGDSSGILIGGGNIIHNGPANLSEYGSAGKAKWAYAGLWHGATIAAAVRQIPVVWNAPGVPKTIEPVMQKRLVTPALRFAEYAAVRDRASVENLGSPLADGLPIVPDTAFEVARMWPKESLSRLFGELLARHPHAAGGRYVGLNIKERSIEGDHLTMATAISDFARATSLTPILVSIGSCHGDDETARAIGAKLTVPHIVLDAPASLREVAATIAFSDLFLASSLHAYITAAAFGVPALLVARPSLPKFAGFLGHVDRDADLVGSWGEAMARAVAHHDTVSPDAVARVQARLDEHWARVAEAIRNPKTRRRAAYRLLRDTVAAGIAAEGWKWMLSPSLKTSRP